MKNLKKFATTLALAGIIMMGVSNAKAGLLMSDFAGGDGSQPCTVDAQFDDGIIVSGFTGIIVSGLTGIIVSGFTAEDCASSDSLTGILMSD